MSDFAAQLREYLSNCSDEELEEAFQAVIEAVNGRASGDRVRTSGETAAPAASSGGEGG